MPSEIEAAGAAERARPRSEIREDGVPFGPGFFLKQLGAFVQQSCPTSPTLPQVRIHVMGGEVLDLCHVVALAPDWVALAVYDASGERGVRTELVPYALVARVTIRPQQEGSRIGFDAARAPEILAPRLPSLSAEQALLVAAGLPAQAAPPRAESPPAPRRAQRGSP